MAASQPFAKLAVLGVGMLLGQGGIGPAVLATVSVPLGELVDAVFHGLDRTRRARVRALCTCLADELAARAQGRDPGTVEAAKLEAERLVHGFGLSERRLVELGLDAGAAADELLQNSRFSRDERIELAPLCRDLLVCFYERLKEQHEFIQELLPDIYGRLLRDTASIRTDVAALRQALEARPALLPQPLPPRPELVGRGDELAGLVRLLLDGDPRPLLVWGGPGIGKTALTTAALHEPEIAARFGDRRYFVALREIRAGEQILDEVGRVIGEPEGQDRPARALRRLEAGGPALLVLDNLETPWETPEQGPATSRALGQLASLPRLRLMASIRGSQKPQGVRWRVKGEVLPLPPDDARELFCTVASEEHRGDPALDALLTALGGVPLAISLMAQRMEDVADAAELLRLWRRERTRLAATGSGDQPDLSLHVSFETSLTSPRLPEAGRRLFALMGRLPQGVLPEDAETLLGGDGFAARSGLRHVGLAQQADGRLVMLPPVREHAAEKLLARADEERLTAWTLALVQSFGLLGACRGSRPMIERARAELVNLETALPALTAAAAAALDVDPAAARDRLRHFAVATATVADERILLGSVALAILGYVATNDGLAVLAAAEPENAGRQYDLGVSNERIGDVRAAQGDLTGAATSYQRRHEVISRLAASDPGNAEWQRDLSVSWSRLGAVRQAQGDLAGALVAYEADLAIAERLATSAPGNTEWQRDLSVSWEKLGEVRRAQGDLAGALAAYEASHAIRERLAASDPGNAGWQRDLSVSWEKLGDVRQAQGDLAGALAAYEAARAIAEHLAASDPGNAGWQRDLSVSWSRRGEERQAQGDLAGALAAYEATHTILERLAASDPGNAGWQRDLSVSWNKLGEMRRALGDLVGALAAYEAGRTIRERLVASDPGNAGWQRDLIVSHWKIAAVLEDMPERRGEAAAHWGRALAVARELAGSGRLAPVDAYFVAELEQRLAAAEGREAGG